MKTVILAIVVLLVVSQAEALTCWCGGSRKCLGRTEVCTGSNNVCATMNNFHGCYTESSCRSLDRPGVASSKFCKTDLCQ
uniref:Uncharacterized protein n=1 Tax=Sander lucioperca TaxID=283035 RepID=A0A8C9ZC20_SANLU